MQTQQAIPGTSAAADKLMEPHWLKFGENYYVMKSGDFCPFWKFNS